MENRIKERIYYIDWLRILAILVVFIFHCAHIFDPLDFHVKNIEKSNGFLIFVVFCNFWMMPLFFLLAGASAWFASGVRSTRQFISERVQRLIIPFVMGVILLVPPQFYLEGLQKGKFAGSFIEYLTIHAKVLSKSLYPSPVIFGSIGHHVWFLAFLFLYSVLTIPVFQFLRGENGRRWIDLLAGLCTKPGALFLFALPPAVIYLALKPVSPMYNDWADFFNWMLVFIFGFILFSRKEFSDSIRKHTYPALATGIISFGICVGLLASGYAMKWFDVPDYSLGCMAFYLLWVLTTWSWMIFFLGMGARFLNFRNRFLSYGSEAVLPFYLLHQTVILLVGFYVVQWNTGMFAKFVAIIAVSFLITIGLYDLLFKRFPYTRYIFGMKLLRREG